MRARSIRRQRLGVIEEDEENGELREIVFERRSSLKRSVKKSEFSKNEIELVSFSDKHDPDVVNAEKKLLVSKSIFFLCKYCERLEILYFTIC